MPSEPENQFEQALKAYAKQRREQSGPPLELHPASRRILQAEAARLRKPAGSPKRSWMVVLGTLWPRVGFAVSICVVLAFAIWLAVPRKQQRASLVASKPAELMEQDTALPLAEKEALRDAVPAEESASVLLKRVEAKDELTLLPMPPVQQNELALRQNGEAPVLNRPANAGFFDEARVSSRKAGEAGQDGAVTNFVLFADAAGFTNLASLRLYSANTQTGQVGVGGLLGWKVEDQRGVVPSAPASSTTSFLAGPTPGQTNAYSFYGVRLLGGETSPALTAADTSQGGRALVQSRAQFRQVAQPARAERLRSLAQPQAILASFEVEQSGDQIRIRDADGSVYEGRLAEAGAKTGLQDLDSNKQLAESLRRSTLLTNAQFLQFQASGTNLRLNQKVEIEANVTSLTDQFSPSGGGGGGLAGTPRRPLDSLGRAVPAEPPASAPATQSPDTQTTVLQRAKAAAPAQVQLQAEPLSTLRLQGKARIGGTNEVQIDALGKPLTNRQ